MKKLVTLSIIALSFIGVQTTEAQVAVGVQIEIAPPEIPVYVQPECPTEGYMWTPGYWAYGAYGYFWVPGVWISPPTIGYLWTPGYWGFDNGIYAWNGGYWGEHMGFYGGVNYGCGYGGSGYYGGRWEGGSFRYNSAVCNVGPSFHNTYVDRTVIVNNNNHTSFNGRGGVSAAPNASEQSAMKEHHTQPTSAQQTHEHGASNSKSQRASINGGHPSVAAKSTVGGQRFNSAGHTMAAPAHTINANTHTASGPQRAAPIQHQSQPVQQHQAQRAAPMQHQSQPMQQHQVQPVQQHQEQHQAQHAAPAQHQEMQQHQNAPVHGGGERK
jgi:hypothetical protein